MKINKAIFRKQNGEQRIMRFVYLDEFPEGFLYSNYYLPRMMQKRILETKHGVIVDIKSRDQAEQELRAESKKLPPGMKRVWDLDSNDFRIFNEKAEVGHRQIHEVEDEKELLEAIKVRLTENM